MSRTFPSPARSPFTKSFIERAAELLIEAVEIRMGQMPSFTAEIFLTRTVTSGNTNWINGSGGAGLCAGFKPPVFSAHSI